MPGQISMSNIYEYLGKGAPQQGDNLSLRNSAIGTTPAVDINNLSAAYNKYGNAKNFSPIGNNTTSMGNIFDWYAAGDFDDANMRFKLNPTAGIDADLYGNSVDHPRTFPYNVGALGVKMNNTSVTAGSVSGTYSYGASSYTTWTSVAAGTSFKFPNTTNTSATICIWFKPTAPASGNRNWIWADMPAVNSFAPYRGWWLAYTSANKLEFNRGDGTGSASGNRKSFVGSATFNGSAGKWQFVTIVISNNSDTLTSSTNWMYAYVWNGSAYAWSNGAAAGGSPGTGGAMAWSADSGTETTQTMMINPSGSAGTGFVHELGHMYVFNGTLTQTQVERVRVMTDLYTV